MRRLVAVARETAVFQFQLHGLNGTAALFVSVLARVRSATAGMREIKKKRAVAAHNDIGMSADNLVIFTFAGLGEEIQRLFLPVARIIGTKHAESFPFINDHPVLIVPAKPFRSFATAFECEAFVGPRREIGTVGVVDGFAGALVVVIKRP